MKRTTSQVALVILFVGVAMGAGVWIHGCSAPAWRGMRASEAARGAPEAQRNVTTWKRSRITPNTSHLKVGDKEELPLRGMQANVRIDGFRARVTLDCYFYNDHNRILEGTFQLRLPEGASPHFLAYGATVFRSPDVSKDQPVFFTDGQSRKMTGDPSAVMADRQETWTKPKEARVVPKEKAAFAYGETVHRRVDPALMEWAGAGVFNARVFPLFPKRLHRIVIGYDVDLTPAGEDFEYRFDLPEKVSKLTADVSVANIPGVDVTVAPHAKPVRTASRSYYRFEGTQARTITVRLRKPGTMALTGRGASGGEYFATRFRPALPPGENVAKPSRKVFLVDTSLSSNPDRFNIYLKLLAALVEKNRDSIDRLNVLFFNVESFWWRGGNVENTPANVRALLAFANNLALEGATDLESALSATARPPGAAEPIDVFLLSDAAATWGESNLHVMAQSLGPATLFAYRTGLAGTDSRALDFLAAETGGAVFSIVGEAEIPKAAVAHRSRPWQIRAVEVTGGGNLMLAGRPRVIYPGQDLVLVGRGTPAANAKIVLDLRRRDGGKAIVTTRLDHMVQSPLAARAYGQIAVAQLEELDAATEEISKAYATHFRVTGRTCSLLMLESEADYRRFNIKPEEDAFVVKSRPADEAVAKALRDLGDALGDPKASFLAWLRKLQHMPGMTFRLPASLRMAIESMPGESFVVSSAPLRCKARTWEAVPAKLRKQLASGKLDYDVLTEDAARRLTRFGPADAIKTVSSLVEKSPGDSVLARDVGFSAMQWGLPAHAYHLFRRVADARPYEPQTYLAMARCLEEMGRADLAMAYFEVGLSGSWAGRFGEFRRIVGLEYVRFLRRVSRGQLQTTVPQYAAARLTSVTGEFDVGKADLVVVILWNTDRTDIDLHVTEPTGEECFYKNPKTRLGARLTRDVTDGYGPEMYVLPKARGGQYRIRAKYYSTDRNRLSARTKVYATVYSGWGTKNEKTSRKVVTLAARKKMHDIAVVNMLQ